MGWVVSVQLLWIHLSKYGLPTDFKNQFPNGLPTDFENQLNTRHCLMLSIVKLFRSGWIKDIHRNKFPTFSYGTSTFVEKFIASKRTNMSHMLHVLHFAIFHIIIHDILKFKP